MRLFVAIDLPTSVKDQLVSLSIMLPGNSRQVRRDALHLTLQFLGDGIDEARLDDIRAALARVDGAAFTLALRGVGQFPGSGRRPTQVLWAGVDAPPGLYALAAQVESALAAVGFPPDGRPFRPHITLARVQPPVFGRDLGMFFEQNTDFATDPFHVDSFMLYASQLTPQGPVYTHQAVYTLR